MKKFYQLILLPFLFAMGMAHATDNTSIQQLYPEKSKKGRPIVSVVNDKTCQVQSNGKCISHKLHFPLKSYISKDFTLNNKKFRVVLAYAEDDYDDSPSSIEDNAGYMAGNCMACSRAIVDIRYFKYENNSWKLVDTKGYAYGSRGAAEPIYWQEIPIKNKKIGFNPSKKDWGASKQRILP
ncbi:hypothetical protein [Lonepinella sp. BR2474]|uniref:hypothetical protein n=1 Tax=Lonepinella sp. BR2474 TaxID=3434548 RepID=UPI003F6DA568